MSSLMHDPLPRGRLVPIRSFVMQVRLLLLAALAGEHILYIGPPGTAKSELGRRLAGLYDGIFFERLLTRFSVPEVGTQHLSHVLCPLTYCHHVSITVFNTLEQSPGADEALVSSF